MRASFLVLAAVALAACTPDDGPLMRPGDDCLRCHGGSPGGTEGQPERHATAWSLAGTVYPGADAAADAGIEGVDVQVTDAAGFAFVLHTNLVGNFYSAESVTFPLRVCVRRSGSTTCMEAAARHGACNLCHALPPTGGAAGRIAAP